MVKTGDTIKIHYTGRLANGTVFETSAGKMPLEFTVGSGIIIPGLDNAVIGMKAGESKTVNISAQDAYGPYCDSLVQEMNRCDMPPDMELEAGQLLQTYNSDGQIVGITVLKVTESAVTFDLNHPLAGEELTVDIEMVEIVC